MSEIKKTLSHTSIYMIGVLLGRLVGFIMLPIYTRHLTPADYGVLELMMMTVDLISVVIGVGINNGIFKFYYKYDEASDRKAIISTAFSLVIVFYLAAAIICILNTSFFADLLFNGKFRQLLPMVFMTMFFQVCVAVPLVYIRVKQKPVLFVAVSILRLVTQLFLNIYFIVYLKKGVAGAVYGDLISTSLFALLLSVYTLAGVRFRFHRKKARELIVFGAPFILTNIGAFILTFSDRYFLKSFCGLQEVGIYSLGYKIGFLLSFVISRSFQNIWEAQRFEVVKQEDYTQTFNQVLTLYSCALFSCALFLSLFSRDLFRIMSSPDFVEAYKIVPIVVAAYVVQGLSTFINFGNIHAGYSINITKGTLLSVIFILFFSLLWIPTLKGTGAALATLMAFLVRFGYIYYSSQKVFRIAYDFKNVYKLILICIICYLGYHFAIEKIQVLNDLVFSILFSFVIFLAYFFILVITNIIPLQYLQAAIQYAVRKLS